jgi:putative ATP-dependent endonuclease of the OLD family
MKLRAIGIWNHSRLQDVEIDVREHLVLVGPNDVGKSSLIRCLDFVLGASTAQLYARLTVTDFRDSDKLLAIQVTLGDLGDQDKALFPDEITVDPVTGDTSLTLRMEATVDPNGSLDIRRTGPGSGTNRQLSRDQLTGLGWKMIGATATARDIRDDRSSAVDDILSSIELGAEKAGFEALVTQLEELLAESAVLSGLRERLAGQLTMALPEIITSDSLMLVPGSAATADVLSDVRLQLSQDGQVRNLTEQSDGKRALFAIALYDLVAESANIVAVDEPEVHLHPASQRSLARLLRRGRNQKIIATHSPDIVGAFRADDVVTVKPGGELVQPQAGFLAGQERMLVHWWVRGKLEPLTARRVIAVEGVSDRIIVLKAAELTGRDLDRLGVSVIETDGAGDMAAIQMLFGSSGFQIPLSILIDEDVRASTAGKMGIPESDLNSRSVWVSGPDLEAEYVAAIGASILWSALQASGLFSSNELALCSASGSGGTRTDADVAGFCRRKKCGYKVRAAIVVADLLTPGTVANIKAVASLLDEIAPAA